MHALMDVLAALGIDYANLRFSTTTELHWGRIRNTCHQIYHKKVLLMG